MKALYFKKLEKWGFSNGNLKTKRLAHNPERDNDGLCIFIYFLDLLNPHGKIAKFSSFSFWASDFYFFFKSHFMIFPPKIRMLSK